MGRSSRAARTLQEAVIREDDPAWLAAMNAPFDDTPDTEQERADLTEARASGRFVSAEDVTSAIAARRSR